VTPPAVLVLSAAIGEGHDLPARVLVADVAERAPGARTEIVDSLDLLRPSLRRMALQAAGGDGPVAEWMFDVNHWLIDGFRPTRLLTSRLIRAASIRRLEALIAQWKPDVVVATYPGASEVLGQLRSEGRLGVPVASAITDLASLRYWAHPGVDLHMVTHPESEPEVRAIAPGARVEAVRGLNLPAFLEPRDRARARRRLGLPAQGPVVLVSGGGWAVGDLEGAAAAALAVEGATVVALAGRNDDARRRLEARFRGEGRVRVLGFTDDLPDLMAAADALVHSTAGLTVLEAICLGCPVISYGWGRGHIRANNRAFERFGLARVVTERAALEGALRQAVAERCEPDRSFASLPLAADLVLGLAGAQIADRG
jgi:processive 1,2-diacylglycerol beta-glucosyltransferase